jgi:lipopolysaccharide transport system permease protein
MSSPSTVTLNTSLPRPHLTIRPPGRWSSLNLTEMWQYRDLFWTLAARDVKCRYRQTALGVIWVILQPLLGAAIFTIVFGRVARLDSDGLPYMVFTFAGLLGWNAFNSTLTKASASVLQNSQLVSKVFFPRLILPLSTILSTLIDFAVAAVVMGVMMAAYGVVPGWAAGVVPVWAILLLPVWLVLLTMLAVGLGLYTSALMVSYRDTQYAIPVLLQFLLYASPVAYSVSVVPGNLRWLYLLNPISGLLQAFRWSLLGKGEMEWGYVAYSAAAVVAVFAFGVLAFKRMERKFADII